MAPGTASLVLLWTLLAPFALALHVASEARFPWEALDSWVRPHSRPWPEGLPRLLRQGHVPAEAPRRGVLHITMTGKGNVTLERAMAGQRTWMRRVLPPDRAVHVCDEDQRYEPRLRSVLVLPEEAVPDRCPRPEHQARKCSGWDKAQLKLPYALVYMYRHLAVNSSTYLPEWWVLKDDDTYIDSENLHLALTAYDSSEPLLIAQSVGCKSVCGGTGIILSWKAAEQVARRGDELLELYRELLSATHQPAYDRKIFEYVKRLAPGTKLVMERNLETSPLEFTWCRAPPRPTYGHGSCHKWPKDDPICECAPSAFPISWHLKQSHLRNAIAYRRDFERIDEAYARSRRNRTMSRNRSAHAEEQ